MSSNRPSRIWRRDKSIVRRRAAERALTENFASTFAPATVLGLDESGELAIELSSMRTLVHTLERLPSQAWDERLPNATRSEKRTAAPIRPRLGASTRLTQGVCAGLAVAVLAFLAGALFHPFSKSSHSRVAISPATAQVILKPLSVAMSGSLAVAYMPGGGQMLVRIRDLPRSASGTYYELWLMSSDTDLVPVSSFRVGASGRDSLQLSLPDDPGHYKYLDISVQHVGDNGAISQNNVLRGAIPS